MTFSARSLVVVSVLLVVVLTGCGKKVDPNLVIAKGRLTKGSEPYKAQLTGPKYPEGEGVGLVEIRLYRVQSDDESLVDDNGDTKVGLLAQSATIQPDGTFEIQGAGQGITAGKYRFVIKHIDPLTDKDTLGGRFNETNSRVTRDITPGQELVIDLGKPPKG